MGYRSDVAYAIQFKDANALKEFVGLHAINEDTREALKECTLALEEDPNDCPALMFNESDVKWYDSFEEVQAHMKLIESVEEMFEDRAGYNFLRLGEEDDDNEHKYGGHRELIPWDAFSFRRFIEIDWRSDEHDDLIGTISKL